MRSTFAKIFLSFWLTELLIVVCTGFILANQFESNEIVYTSLFALMESNAHRSVEAYETGGCKALATIPNVFPLAKWSPPNQPAILFDIEGKPLCQQVDLTVYEKAVKKMRKDGFLIGERHGPNYLEGIGVKDAAGQTYFYLMRGTYPTEIYIPYREMLPRLLIGLIISVVVTFGLTMIITRPIGSLREAARHLSAGNLKARAKWPKGRKSSKTGDELWGLVYDFNEMADRLESLVDAQKLLMRDVSHELRSPLARLSVALELAREEAASTANSCMEVQLARIERETGRLNALIGQLLNLSQLESSTRLPDQQRVALSHIVTELLPDMKYEAERRNCQVRFVESNAAGRDEVMGSPRLLVSAIENVIRNAIAYTAEGTSVDIEIASEPASTMDESSLAGNGSVFLRVRDHGPGVPEQALKAIFRPFYRQDLSRQRSTGGYGVGLAITERAIHLHDGVVEARNAADGGLVVEMRLTAAGDLEE